ncbi:hypothetical protein BGZ49_008463 [Haplosporangium sp. Z 27]|nr:hypothetical protein BGZ49_008463 [Haplosporangium sp. Z 27]
MSAYIANIQSALSSAEISAAISHDDGDFVGCLYDTILYERACYRLYELKKYDFPLRYDELAHDFLMAYRFCLDPKFLANRRTAVFSHLILHSKLMTASGVRKWVQDHGGIFDTFPSDSDQFMDGEDVEELNDDDFSDYDEADGGMGTVRKNVGYNGPILTRARQSHYAGPISEGQGHRDGMANGYFVIYKHSQDMIAAIIVHLRRKVWHNNGSGGEIVDIQNMGVDGKGKDNQGDTTETTDRAVPNVKGVKKYTRRFNGKRKRANYNKRLQDGPTGFFRDLAYLRDPPTDYSDSETEDQENGNSNTGDQTAGGIDEAIDKMLRISLSTFTGSPKKTIQWLPLQRLEIFYDWNGPNEELRLVDLPSQEEDPTFYGRLTRDLLAKYKELQPAADLIKRHQTLKASLEKIISNAFPGEELKVEAYGGLLTTNSDADFCITGPDVHRHNQLNDMNHLADILRSRGNMQNIVSIPDAMVPIVKFLDPATQMECDLNTGNNLGVINSDLIRIYTTIDDRVKPFLFMIKAICKAQGINNSKSGYLSSYAITWMGIVFLQQKGTYGSSTWAWGPVAILPRLQQQPFERMKETTLRINHNTKNTVVSVTSLINSNKSDMVHCRYDDNSDGKHTKSGRGNTKTLARLVIEFFEFFSRRFNYIETTIHAARGQILPKTNRELHHENSRLPTFRVVDPFLHHRNITGTARGESLGRVWRAFDHSYRMLSAGDLEGAMQTVL